MSEVVFQNTELIYGVVLLEPAVRGQRLYLKAIDSERTTADDATIKQYFPGKLRAQFTLLMQQLNNLYGDIKALPQSIHHGVIYFHKTSRGPVVFRRNRGGKQQWRALHLALITSRIVSTASGYPR